MKLPNLLGLVYGILVLLIVSLGVWWVIFLTAEGKNYERYHLQRLEAERIRALGLAGSIDPDEADRFGRLEKDFPDLTFRAEGAEIDVRVDRAARERIVREARRRSRMFISEGVFFLALLAAGTTVIVLAYRREREYKSARELFLAGATHEFRTPLASLKLFAETLNRPELEKSDREEITGAMIKDIHRLDLLVERVLAMSREEGLQQRGTETFDLASETEKVLADMEGFFQAGRARIETELAPGCLVRGVRSAFRVSLSNLVQNAVLYSPPPGRVTVTLARHGAHFRLSVRDRGPGIARRFHRKIFRSFFRLGTDRVKLPGVAAGSGLGLYLVRRNMEILGGKVELDCPEGGGSVFTLVVPALEGEES